MESKILEISLISAQNLKTPSASIRRMQTYAVAWIDLYWQLWNTITEWLKINLACQGDAFNKSMRGIIFPSENEVSLFNLEYSCLFVALCT